MFQLPGYNWVILSIVGSVLGLLGTVGIFVSLVIQRRVEKLQDILDEIVDLSYESEQNLTANIFRLIQRYQMYYILPIGTTKSVLQFLDYALLFSVLCWLSSLLTTFKPPLQIQTLIYILPIAGAMVLMLLYRNLLKNAFNPLEYKMFNVIITPPTQLRSVAFLSSYVNVSVRSLLQQARLSTVVRKVKGEENRGQSSFNAEIVLKQELSFDDFFYYYCVPLHEGYFVAFGFLQIQFPQDSVTRKPVPVGRNVNIPLGWTDWDNLPTKQVKATLFILPPGEKHPIRYTFDLYEENSYYAPFTKPVIRVDRDITFTINNAKIAILEGHEKIPAYELCQDWLLINKKRMYWSSTKENKEPKECSEGIYIR
jgi:hypothetical protein